MKAFRAISLGVLAAVAGAVAETLLFGQVLGVLPLILGGSVFAIALPKLYL